MPYLIAMTSLRAAVAQAGRSALCLAPLAKGLSRQVCPWRRYNTYIAHYKENECMRIALEPIFSEFGVDLVFTGCVLQSSCPLAVMTRCCVGLLRVG